MLHAVGISNSTSMNSFYLNNYECAQVFNNDICAITVLSTLLINPFNNPARLELFCFCFLNYVYLAYVHIKEKSPCDPTQQKIF